MALKMKRPAASGREFALRDQKNIKMAFGTVTSNNKAPEVMRVKLCKGMPSAESAE
jgi:hypothetical protein